MYRPFVLLVPLAMAACEDTENPDEVNENEVITTVVLRFTSPSGTALEFSWADPENDGSPVIDDIVLSDADNYALAVSFLNELEDPPEDITEEVDAESDEHQVFFTGTAVDGADPVVAHTYDDSDANGFPVGLASSVTTARPGSGTFLVTLRHLPPENDTPTKVDGLAEQAATVGIESLPGDTDASVTFDLEVQ